MSTTTATPEVSFSFGENWKDFIRKCYSPERLEISRKWLLDFLGLPDLTGKYFLDIGCGSGLSSLAAFAAGAERIVSFDIDPASVETTRLLWKDQGAPPHWSIHHGSVLDSAFLDTIDAADIVYSWGVLHHTGAMWDAIANARRLLKNDGLFYIALYTTANDSESWLAKKRKYNAGGSVRKRMMELSYIFHDLIRPFWFRPWRIRQKILSYRNSRGMSYFHDVRDWLGGYPYEFARVEEVLKFARHELGLEWKNLRTGEACTEYLFANRD